MKRFIGIVVLFLGGLTACDRVLDLSPENSITFKNALETENDMEAAVRSIAQGLRDISYSEAYWNEEMGYYADHVMGEIENNWRNLKPQEVRMGDWSVWYNIIARANVVLHFVDQIDATKERKDYYRGQACFYKAMAYFNIVRKWGDCVIVGDEADLEPVAKSPWTEVIGYAIGLTRDAVSFLPDYNKVKDANGNAPKYKDVPCKGAANALLAHLCAWKAGGKYYAQPDQRDYDESALWEEAEKACTAIIGSEIGTATGVYRLVANPEEVCTTVLRGNSTEGIFEAEYRTFWNEYNLNSQGDKPMIDMLVLPYHAWIMFQTVGMGPESIQICPYQIYATTAKNMFPEGDLRRESYFWKLDSMSHDTLSHITGGQAYPYAYRKIRVKTSGDNAGQFEHFDYNQIYWRLADIYLLRAECRARLDKKTEAIADLNEIRKRASAKLYNASEHGGDLRYTIFKEREKELLYEGYRYFDIIRNQYARRELSEGFRKASDQDFIDGCFFFALRGDCFERNPLLRQNTWWHKYL